MIFAIVPAAGLSTRMGRPKLVLEIAGVPLIRRVVEALKAGGVDRVVVVVGPDSQEGTSEVAELAWNAGASLERLDTPTADMRSTIEEGLKAFSRGTPRGVMIVPADSVGLTGGLVSRMIGEFRRDPSAILVPVRDGRRGHPLILPWGEAQKIVGLPPDMGVNALLRRPGAIVREVEVTEPGHDADLDTPEDYRRWAGG